MKWHFQRKESQDMVCTSLLQQFKLTLTSCHQIYREILHETKSKINKKRRHCDRHEESTLSTSHYTHSADVLMAATEIYELYSLVPSAVFSYLSLVRSMRFNILALSAFLFLLSAAVSHCSLWRRVIKWPLWLTDLLNLRRVFSIGSSSLQINFTAMLSLVAVSQ